MNEWTRLAEAFGEPYWAAGPGGNVSIKMGDRVRVKASGRRLAELSDEGATVEVPIETARRALAGDPSANRGVFSARPRPSMETYLHALEGRVVVHTHSAGVLLAACAEQGCLQGSLTVPYIRPGRELAIAIERLRTAASRVMLLQSHGLLVYADTVEEAIERTSIADERAKRAFGLSPEDAPDFEAYKGAPLARSGDAWIRQLPTADAPPFAYLFPDAAVYARAAVVSDPAAIADLDPNDRVAIAGECRWARATTQAQLDATCEIVAVHDWVSSRLGARALPLPQGEPVALMALPQEVYRLHLRPS